MPLKYTPVPVILVTRCMMLLLRSFNIVYLGRRFVVTLTLNRFSILNVYVYTYAFLCTEKFDAKEIATQRFFLYCRPKYDIARAK